jgi:Type II intron maturase
VFKEATNFLNTHLKLAISEEKSGIHHAKDGTSFLGYVVQNYTDEKLLKIHRVNTKVVSTRRTMRDRIQLRIPEKKLSEFCQRKGYGTYETTYPSYKPSWLRMDDEEILLAYNAEMQSIANYYALATGAKEGLSKLLYNWLRVLGTAELAQVNQRIRQQLHPIVPLLDAFKTQ